MKCPTCAVDLPQLLLAKHVAKWHEPVAFQSHGREGVAMNAGAAKETSKMALTNEQLMNEIRKLQDDNYRMRRELAEYAHIDGDHSDCDPNECESIHDRAAESWDRAMASY